MKKILLYLCIVFLVGCGKVSSDKGNSIFKEHLTNQIPSEIQYLEAKENNMLGTAILVFKVNRQSFINITRAYKPVDKGTVLVQARDWMHKDVLNGKDVFSYYRSEQEGGKKREYYLFWVEEKGQGYFLTMIY